MFDRLAGLALFVIPIAIALSVTAYAVRPDGDLETRRSNAVFVCFCIYVAIVGTVTLGPPPMSFGNGHFGSNFVPLVNSFRCFIPNPGQPSTTRFCLETIAGNIVLLFPLGFLLPLLLPHEMSARRMLIVALVASVSIELLQFVGRWVGNPRWSDVDDVIFNVVGALAGFALLRAFSRRKIPLRVS